MRIVFIIGLLCLSSCSTLQPKSIVIEKSVVAPKEGKITNQEKKAAAYIMQPTADPVVIESLRKSLGQP